VPLVSISDAQRRPVPDANWVATIYHGIELDEFTFNPQMGGHLAFLGRISPDKGLDTAIRVARRTGVPLLIAARLPLPHMRDPNVQVDWAYSENEIQPLLEGRQGELVVGQKLNSCSTRYCRDVLLSTRSPRALASRTSSPHEPTGSECSAICWRPRSIRTCLVWN